MEGGRPRPEYLTEYSGLDREAAEVLYNECGVLNFGQDAPSIDSAADRAFPCHMVCRELRRINTENLCNLEAVAGRQFLYSGLPLKIRNGTGSPIRAIAILDS
jgi:kynurenine formamidase